MLIQGLSNLWKSVSAEVEFPIRGVCQSAWNNAGQSHALHKNCLGIGKVCSVIQTHSAIWSNDLGTVSQK